MRPPFFPIVPDQLVGDVRFHDTGDDDFPIGHAKVRSRWVRHVGPTLGFPGRVERRVGCVRARSRSGLQSRAPRRLHPERDARAVRRGRPVDPRRAAHQGGVRGEAALGSLHHRVRRPRGPRVRRPAPRALPPRSRARRRRRSTRSNDPRSSTPRASVRRKCSRRTRVSRSSLLLPCREPDEPSSQTNPGARSGGHANSARSLRHRRGDHHRDGRRRAGRHGVQLVHVGLARAAARVVLRGEVVVDLAAHPGCEEVGGEHPRRGRRGDLPAVRAEGRRPLRARLAHRGPDRFTPARRRDRVRRLRDRRRARRRRSPHRRRTRARARLRPRVASRCSSTAAATAASRSELVARRCRRRLPVGRSRLARTPGRLRCRSWSLALRLDCRLVGRGSPAHLVGSAAAPGLAVDASDQSRCLRNLSARWMRVVAAMIADTATTRTRIQPTRPIPMGKAKLATSSSAAPRPSWARTVGERHGRLDRRSPGSRAGAARSSARRPGGPHPPSGPPGRRPRGVARARDDPRDPEDERCEQGDADDALRDPIGAGRHARGRQSLDRLIHSRTLTVARFPETRRVRRALCAAPDHLFGYHGNSRHNARNASPFAPPALPEMHPVRYAACSGAERLGGVNVRRGDPKREENSQAASAAVLAGIGGGQVLANGLDVSRIRERTRRGRLWKLAFALVPVAAYLYYRLATRNFLRLGLPQLHPGADPDPAAGRPDRRALPRADRPDGRDGQVAARALRRRARSRRTLDDVVGIGPVKDEVVKTLNLFLGYQTFRRVMGGNPRKGVLFEGPPGTGKTYMAKAMAHEAGVPFLFVSSTAFQSQYYGATGRKIRNYFKELRKAAAEEGGAIGFIEEIDAIAGARSGMRSRPTTVRTAPTSTAPTRTAAPSSATRPRASRASSTSCSSRCSRSTRPRAATSSRAGGSTRSTASCPRTGASRSAAAEPPNILVIARDQPRRRPRPRAACARVASTGRSTSTCRAAPAAARSSTTTSIARRTSPSSTRRSVATRSPR